MTYTPPAYNAINTDVASGTAIPAYNAINVDMDSGSGPVAVSLGTHFDLVYLLGVTVYRDNYYDLLYDMSAERFNYYIQPYEIFNSLVNHFNLPYFDIIEAFFDQFYSDSDILKADFVQWYTDVYSPKAFYVQKYGDAFELIRYYEQKYSIQVTRSNFFDHIYNILGVANVNYYEQVYKLLIGDKVNSHYNEVYKIASDGHLVSSSHSLTINGANTAFISAVCEFSLNEYPGVLEIELVNYTDWDSADYLQEVVFINGSDTYNFLIFDKTKSEDVKSVTLSIECRSQGYTLDFPYADPVEEDFTVTMASVTVNALAALEGLTIDWQIPVDWLLSSDSIQLGGESPLTGILKIVNAVGGVLQSNPDGTLYAAPRDIVDTDKYLAAQPDTFLTTGENYETTESTADKRNGYNVYFISDVPSTSSSYALETITVSENEILVKAYQDPWDNVEVELVTSDLESVTIERLADVNDEALCEVIEIVEGGGSTSKPICETVEYSYSGRDDLGNITASESGDLTTFISGESIVQYSYLSRYRQWRVIDFETENVQLTLRTI